MNDHWEKTNHYHNAVCTYLGARCFSISYQLLFPWRVTYLHPSKFFAHFMYALHRLNRCTFFTTTSLSQDIAGRCHFCDYHRSRLRLEQRPSFFHTKLLAYASLPENRFDRKSFLLKLINQRCVLISLWEKEGE